MESRTDVSTSNRSTASRGANGQDASQAGDAANTVIQQAKDTFNPVIKQAKETLNQGVDKVTKSSGQIYDSAIQYSKKNTGTALGIALGSGAALGFIIGRSSKSRFDDTLWGAVTTAALRAAISRWR